MATENDKVNSGALGTIVAVGTFATLSIVLGVDALVRYETSKISAERASHASDRYRSMVAEQNAKLASAGWVDKSKGIVALPITQAMGHVIADLARDPLSASPEAPDAGAPAAIAPDAAAGTTELGDAASPEAAPGSAPATSASGTVAPPKAPAASGAVAPPKAPAAPAASGAVAPPKAPAAPAASGVSPKASTVLAVPPAPPAARPPAPAPAASAPSDG